MKDKDDVVEGIEDDVVDEDNIELPVAPVKNSEVLHALETIEHYAVQRYDNSVIHGSFDLALYKQTVQQRFVSEARQTTVTEFFSKKKTKTD